MTATNHSKVIEGIGVGYLKQRIGYYSMSSKTTDFNDRLAQIQNFLLICDRFKQVVRRGYLIDGSRRETDAEHVWHMALYALLLKDEIGFEVDIGKVLSLVLVHDLVEIYAGDTFAYDDIARQEQDLREAIAAKKLFGLLPSDLREEVNGWWVEFETGSTPEARYARALDRLQGFSQTAAGGGKMWREYGISRERKLDRMREALDSDPAICALAERLYERADREGSWGG